MRGEERSVFSKGVYELRDASLPAFARTFLYPQTSTFLFLLPLLNLLLGRATAHRRLITPKTLVRSFAAAAERSCWGGREEKRREEGDPPAAARP